SAGVLEQMIVENQRTILRIVCYQQPRRPSPYHRGARIEFFSQCHLLLPPDDLRRTREKNGLVETLPQPADRRVALVWAPRSPVLQQIPRVQHLPRAKGSLRQLLGARDVMAILG